VHLPTKTDFKGLPISHLTSWVFRRSSSDRFRSCSLSRNWRKWIQELNTLEVVVQ